MKFTDCAIVLQEVPGETCLAISISGCPFRCHGCHTPELQTDTGTPLTMTTFQSLLDSYRSKHTNNYIFTCVLFFGGEQHNTEFIQLLQLCKDLSLNTCLYTGAADVDSSTKQYLDYLKTGPYIASLGPLDRKTTNQRLVDLRTNTDITHKLQES